MAALVLGAAGAAIGPELFGTTAFSLFGVGLSGASLGGVIGSFAGSTIDNALLGGLHTARRKRNIQKETRAELTLPRGLCSRSDGHHEEGRNV